jgi:hypothetical protein
LIPVSSFAMNFLTKFFGNFDFDSSFNFFLLFFTIIFCSSEI